MHERECGTLIETPRGCRVLSTRVDIVWASPLASFDAGDRLIYVARFLVRDVVLMAPPAC